MIALTRTTTSNPEFKQLIHLLDEELWQRNGSLQNVLGPFNKMPDTDSAVVVTVKGVPAGCGCFKVIDENTVEVKRMFVRSQYRGKGIAQIVLNELEAWAVELNFRSVRLETSINMVEAIQLYKKHGYSITEKYPPYVDVEESVCMMKPLKER